MPSEAEIIIAFLFKRSGKAKLSFSELYLTLSMDLNWFTPDDAKSFLNLTLKQKLLEKKGEIVQPAFDYERINVPIGFIPSKQVFEERVVAKPTVEKATVLEKIIKELVEKTKLDQLQVTEKINKLAEEKTITKEVAALLVGKEYAVSLEVFFEEVEENKKNKKKKIESLV
ncbi:MAG: DUF2240 family protein [Thermoplasmatales archaeon]|nr:DUF2240 family protein [Thermoplasmatales archaeon]